MEGGELGWVGDVSDGAGGSSRARGLPDDGAVGDSPAPAGAFDGAGDGVADQPRWSAQGQGGGEPALTLPPGAAFFSGGTVGCGPVQFGMGQEEDVRRVGEGFVLGQVCPSRSAQERSSGQPRVRVLACSSRMRPGRIVPAGVRRSVEPALAGGGAVRQAGRVSVVSVPAPVALARLVDTLTPAGAPDPVWERKWDGFRVLCAGGRLYSRRATNLTAIFPDLAPALTARLPADLVLDGEAVVWDTAAGRLDFDALQARMTAGRRLRAAVDRGAAQLVVFDVLSAGGEDLRGRPLHERRVVLERQLSGVGPPIVLCQQTADLAIASEWFRTLAAGGIEGLVIKDRQGVYPTREGQRVWWKVKTKATLDMLAIGYTGTTTALTSLVLAFPGVVDKDGEPVTAGSTTVLARTVTTGLLPLLRPTGRTFERTFAWGTKEPTTVTVVEPFVVEVEADASATRGVLRHGARLRRARPDLDPAEA